MPPDARTSDALHDRIEEVRADAGAEAVAVALYDFAADAGWGHRADRPFHSASTIKLAILVALYRAFEAEAYRPTDWLHVRNRFLSAADGSPYRIDTSRDANSDVHARLGQLMRLEDLARHMIQTSSNLATNLLVDLLGVPAVQEAMEALGVEGVTLVRGVEDEAAWAAGINNRVTAGGLTALLRTLHAEDAFAPDTRRAMLDVLMGQEFTSGIPAGLPDGVREAARVAHKTGEISTVTHDAGLVYLPGRAPYALTVLTEWDAASDVSHADRRKAVAECSAHVYRHLTDADD